MLNKTEIMVSFYYIIVYVREINKLQQKKTEHIFMCPANAVENLSSLLKRLEVFSSPL